MLFPRAILPRHTIRNLSEAGKAPARPWPWLAPGAPGGKTSLEKVQKYRSGLVVGCIYFFLGCTSQPCAVCWWVIPERDIHITSLGFLNFSVCPHREGRDVPAPNSSVLGQLSKSAALLVGVWLLHPPGNKLSRSSYLGKCSREPAKELPCMLLRGFC